MSNVVNKLLAHEKIKVNGADHHNLLQVIDRIKHNKKAINELAAYQQNNIHGDLTIDNLIVSDKGDFLLLDPNNENDVSSKAVDLGKLYQSLHSGYEFLIQLDQCTVKQHHIRFEDSKSHKYAEIFRMLDKKLKKDLDPKDYYSIIFHEAVHYCRMLTYRVNINEATVPVFYGTAVKLFNEFLEQYE
jgi:tRNA A-37 threonylcarbamoyl transferase component Bud32